MAVLRKAFLQEYALWLVAPAPFLLPWVCVKFWKGALFEAIFPTTNTGEAWPRFLENVVLWISSYGFAFVLYHGARYTRFARLKYNPRIPDVGFIATEVLRSFGGVVVLTALQLLGLSWRPATGTLPSVPSVGVWLLVIAFWADLHFYSTHRLLHTKVLYRHVHRTHHRSINTDPFSGLSFHPVEHVLYFSAILLPGPIWVMNLISIALVVWPIPAHFGYGPFDRHHYDHHTRFHYNFGSSMLFDELFGTTLPATLETEADVARDAEARKQREMTVGASSRSRRFDSAGKPARQRKS